MPKTTRFTVDIDTSRYSGGDLPALFDMLRYESGRVVAWDRTERGFRLNIEVETPRFVPDRWASFMLYPKVVS